MRGRSTILSAECCLIAAVVFAAWLAWAGQPALALDPLTYVYDIPESSAMRLSDGGLAEQAGWLCLEEDDTAHAFDGCAVLMNDKLVAVQRKAAAHVDLYTRRNGVATLCARLRPLCAGRTELGQTSLVLRENSRSSASLEVGYRTPSGMDRHVTYELSAGAAFLKTTASTGVEQLRVEAPCRYAILPDFFGDDMVVDAAALPVQRAELPSENFLLHLLHNGNTIVMTVSESRDNDIAISLSETRPREIVASDIAYGGKSHVWVAVLSESGVWHERAIAEAEAGQVLPLDWQMPYAALWRVDWTTADGMTDTWEMLLQHPNGKYVMQGWFGQDEAEGQRFGEEFGARDWNKPGRQRWNPVLGSFSFPCWVDTDRHGYLQPLKPRAASQSRGEPAFVGPAVIYPIDRLNNPPFVTPLQKLTVVDLVRMTLGVGPCQYILDLEGQKRNSRGVATCYARDVINDIYKRSAQTENGPVIEQHLAEAVAFITNVRERIDLYVEFGRELSAYLEEQARLDPQQVAFAEELRSIALKLEGLFEQQRAKIRSPQDAAATADRFRHELLTYTGKDAFAKCDEQMRVFTSIGGAQDGLVASCRTIVKTLRQRAGIAMTVDPRRKSVATEVRNRCQAILRNPTAYEAPRH